MDAMTIAAAIKALGATAGAFLALIFQPPKSVRDFVLRSIFSTLSGFLFADPVRSQYLKWPDEWQMWLASAALVALGSWWVFGAAIRIVKKWTPPT